MANHKNDHSRELIRTVAVRAEVDRALSQASLPANKRREVAEKVEQIVDRYSSPYPDPKFLEQVESLASGSAREIITCAINEVSHRQRMDEEAIAVKKEEIAL